MKHCLVKDGTILKYNVNKPKVIVGTQDGVYLPIEDNVPAIDTSTHRIAGSTYEVQSDKVVKTYNVVEIPIEEIIAKTKESMEKAIQKHINDKCVELGYDNENSIAKYLVSGNPFYDECSAISLWIGTVWIYAYQVQVDVQDGKRDMPTIDELIDELPIYGE